VDILLDANSISSFYGDSVWVNGPLTKAGTTQLFTQTVAQRLRIRLLSFQEEWFLDQEYGVPYFQRVLGMKPTKSAIDLIFQQEILDVRGVREITFFSSTLQNRIYSLSFRVRVVTGEETETISLNPIN
jgi:hypothetical protein